MQLAAQLYMFCCSVITNVLGCCAKLLSSTIRLDLSFSFHYLYLKHAHYCGIGVV